MVKVGGEIEGHSSSGEGPVNAWDNAVRKAPETFQPEIKRDEAYRTIAVRLLAVNKGTGGEACGPPIEFAEKTMQKIKVWHR